MRSKKIRKLVMGMSVAGLIAAGSLPLMAQNTGSKSCDGAKNPAVTSKQSQTTVPGKVDNPSLSKGKIQQLPASKAGQRADDAPAETRKQLGGSQK
jgi:hypothetical protein